MLQEKKGRPQNFESNCVTQLPLKAMDGTYQIGEVEMSLLALKAKLGEPNFVPKPKFTDFDQQTGWVISFRAQVFTVYYAQNLIGVEGSPPQLDQNESRTWKIGGIESHDLSSFKSFLKTP